MQTKDEVSLRIPMTDAQKQLLLLAHLDPQAALAYNVAYAVELEGPLQAVVLKQAVGMAIARHESLRSHLSADGESMVVEEPAPAEMVEEDLSNCDATMLRQRLVQESSYRFNLTGEILARTRLFQLGKGRHLLLIVTHHVNTDGVSMAVVLRELGQMYSVLVEGSEPMLPPAVQYREYLARSARGTRTEERQQTEAYWAKVFQSPPPPLALPSDRQRPGDKSYRGDLSGTVLPLELGARLRAMSADCGCTLFMIMFAAFALVLHKMTGQGDFVIGVPVPGRPDKASREVVGYLANLLPVRMFVDKNATLLKLLQSAAQTLFSAFEHQDYTFSDFARQLRPVRLPGRSPILDVAFNFDPDVERFEFYGLQARIVPVPVANSKFDIDFNVLETRRGFLAEMEYSTDLFEKSTIQRMLRLWAHLLDRLPSLLNTPVADISILDEQERQHSIMQWNQSGKQYPPEFVPEIISRHAEQNGSVKAIVYEGAQLTYRELEEQSNRLARHLQTLGIGPETRIGVFLERGIEWVVAILAVWKAGGVYVALDVAYPKDRVAFMLQDAGIHALVTLEALASELPQSKEKRVLLDAEWERIWRQSNQPLPLAIRPEHLAYIMYTSGSTGKPKGAMLEHRGMMNHIWSKVEDLGMSARDVVAQIASTSFDVSVWQIFAALLVGGQVQIVGEEIARDAALLLKEVQRLGVTVMETVPTMLALMLEQQLQDGIRKLALEKLRWMISNAEALPASLCRRWVEAYPRISLLNAYGPTECSDDIAHYVVPNATGYLWSYAPLGQPIGNMTEYVLDESLDPVPLGVPGELHIGGIGVGRGYLNRPILTAERFVPNPFSDLPGSRMYRTGDQVRRLVDGTLEFLGRFDHQVKLRGQRIELTEIESAMNEYATVLRCVVIVREDEPGDRRLAAYVVPRRGAELNVAEMRAYLRERLPEYMVPNAIVPLAEMPLTANEKIDREALPRPGSAREELEKSYAAPRNPTESALAAIWMEALTVPRVGIHDGFFELGGHSLLATRVVSRIRNQFQTPLTLRMLFDNPTIARLAQVMANLQTEQGTGGTIPRRENRIQPVARLRAQTAAEQ